MSEALTQVWDAEAHPTTAAMAVEAYAVDLVAINENPIPALTVAGILRKAHAAGRIAAERHTRINAHVIARNLGVITTKDYR